GNSKAVAVRGDAADHTFEDGVVAVDVFLGCPGGRGRPPHTILNRSKAQRVHNRHGARAHGKNVADNSGDARSCTLERLHERWMIVRLALEGTGPAVPDVNDSRVLARPLQDTAAVSRQSLEMNARGFIGAVLTPHHTENAELRERWLAPAQQGLDAVVFVERQPVVTQNFGSNG